MTDIMNWLKGLALVSVTVLALTASYTTVTVGKHVSATLMSLDDTLDKVNGKYGTIVELNKTLVDTKNLVAHSDILIYQEQKSLKDWNAQIGDTLATLNTTLASVKTTSDVTAASEVQVAAATTQTIQGVQPVLSSATAELQALKTATDNINTLVTDPDVTATLANVNGTTKNLDDTSVEVKQYVHSILHPSWAKRLWGYTVDLAHAVL